MSEKKTGGPAFPCEFDMNTSGVEQYAGLSVRDYFAAHAPVEALDLPRETAADVRAYLNESSRYGEMPANWKHRVQAKARYRYADAMLRARAE